MAHLTLAKIWTDLLPGTDLNDVLREIVGEHALSIAGKSAEAVRFLSFRIAVWIKAIFDIQRSRFSSSPPPQLLSSNHLLAAIYKVVEIRTEVFLLEDRKGDEYARQRCFVVQAVLSGLRAMLLHSDNHNDEQSHILELHPHILSWRTPEKDLEEFAINKCLDATRCINTIPRLVGLNVESDFRAKLAELRAGEDNAFWSLFDILWATEEDFIYSLAGSRRTQLRTQPFAHELDPGSVSEECLVEVVLGWCGGNCDCVERLNSQQYLPASGQSQTGTFLQTHLEDFERFLRRRQQRLLGIASRVPPAEIDEIVGPPSSTGTLGSAASLSTVSTTSDPAVADTPQTSECGFFGKIFPRRHRRTPSTNDVDRSEKPREKAKRQNHPPPPQSHRFSADGKTLLLWTKDGDHVSASVIPADNTQPWDWRRYDVPGVQSAAGGDTPVAAISKNRQLLVFPGSGNLVLFERIVASGEILGMTMSRGGGFVAVALEPEMESKNKSMVLVYEIMGLEIRQKCECDLERSSPPGSQEIEFTSDDRLITARREITGKITIGLYGLDGSRTWGSVMDIGKPDNGDDHGLSSVLYNSVANVAVVTMYTSIKYSVFHYDGSPLVPAESRFQGVTQSPSGNVVMFADSKNNLLPYYIDKKCYDGAILLKRKRFLAGRKDDLMALAMPNEKTVHTFWVENGKMMLTTTSLKADNRWEPIPRPILEIKYRVDGLEENS